MDEKKLRQENSVMGSELISVVGKPSSSTSVSRRAAC